MWLPDEEWEGKQRCRARARGRVVPVAWRWSTHHGGASSSSSSTSSSSSYPWLAGGVSWWNTKSLKPLRGGGSTCLMYQWPLYLPDSFEIKVWKVTQCVLHTPPWKRIRKYIRSDIRKRRRVRQRCRASLMDKSGEKALKMQEHIKHKNTCTQAHGAHKHHFTQMSNKEDALTCKRTIPPTEQTFSPLVSTQYGVQENPFSTEKGAPMVWSNMRQPPWCVILQDSWWCFIHLRLGHPRPPPIFCPPALLLCHQRVTSPLWLIAPALHKLSHLALSRAQRHKHLLTQTHTKTERHRRCLIAALHQLAHPHPPNEPPINSVFSQHHCYKRH